PYEQNYLCQTNEQKENLIKKTISDLTLKESEITILKEYYNRYPYFLENIDYILEISKEDININFKPDLIEKLQKLYENIETIKFNYLFKIIKTHSLIKKIENDTNKTKNENKVQENFKSLQNNIYEDFNEDISSKFD